MVGAGGASSLSSGPHDGPRQPGTQGGKRGPSLLSAAALVAAREKERGVGGASHTPWLRASQHGARSVCNVPGGVNSSLCRLASWHLLLSAAAAEANGGEGGGWAEAPTGKGRLPWNGKGAKPWTVSRDFPLLFVLPFVLPVAFQAPLGLWQRECRCFFTARTGAGTRLRFFSSLAAASALRPPLTSEACQPTPD